MAVDNTTVLIATHEYSSSILSHLLGPQNYNLKQIQRAVKTDDGDSIDFIPKGILISGTKDFRDAAEKIFNEIIGFITTHDRASLPANWIEDIIREGQEGRSFTELKKNNSGVQVGKIKVEARSPNQNALLNALERFDLVFAVGPAGTGKTHLACAYGAKALMQGDVDRLIITRPAVEVGKSLGALPGGLAEKLDPYLRPIYDSLREILGGNQKALDDLIKSGKVEIATIQHMRGRTFKNAYVIVDEGQNSTYSEMKMAITRLGQASKMVITGDPSQTDLRGEPEGLSIFVKLLENAPKLSCRTIRLDKSDIVRHPLIAEILHLTDAYEKNKS